MAKARSLVSTPSTYAELQKHIAELQLKAEALKAQEVSDVIGRIREAIQVYGITAEDLFGSPRRRAKQTLVGIAPSAKASRAAKYKDPATGKTWNGVGKRPGWIVSATEAGADPQSLAI